MTERDIDDDPDRTLESVRALKRRLVSYFADFGLLPILISRGHAIGDVIALEHQEIIRRGEACFPRLKTSRKAASTLPSIVHVTDMSLSFALGLAKLLRLTARGSNEVRTTISFRDAEIETVALDDLSRALALGSADLRPLLDGGEPVTLAGRPVVIVAGIMHARREARIESRDEKKVKAVADALSAAVTGLPFDVSAQAEGAAATRGQAVLVSKKPEAVAFQPSHIPRMTAGAVRPVAGRLFDTYNDGDPQHRAILAAMGQAWAESPEPF
jgi:hypothetical protein